MAIKIGVFTIVLKKVAIAEHYQGGIEAFRRDYACVEDEDLFGLRIMSGSDLDALITQLRTAGIALPASGAIGEMFTGAIESNPEIEFVQTERWPPAWEARIISSDH